MNNMNQCGVCCEKFSAVIRKEIVCRNAACKYPVCRGCTEHYIIDSTQDAHCMSCRNGWDIEFLTSNFSKKFITKDYKTHRENILFDREKSMLPATLPVAEFVQVVHTIKQETKAKLKVVEDEIDDLKMNYKTHHADAPNIPYADLIARTSFDDVSVDIYSRVQANMYIKQKLEERLTKMCNYLRTPQDYMHGGVSISNKAVTEKRQFIRGCPGADCRGFLSTQWKCGLCHINVCKDCHEIVSTGGTGAEGDAEGGPAHVCKDENLKTVALLAKDTRSCPKCAAQIFKIDGCFAENTPILLWNGTSKLSQDISIGDVLVGDDGQPRKVLELCTGEDEMYKVEQTNGVSYTVNSKHILVLKFSGDRIIYWKDSEKAWEITWFDHNIRGMRRKKFSAEVSKDTALLDIEHFKKTIMFTSEIQISVSDFMQMNKSCKKNMMGFKSGEIHWDHQDTKLDPYLMGLWIGDGVNNEYSFAANDKEVIEYLVQWCDDNNCDLVHAAAYTFNVRRREYSQGRFAIGKGSSCSNCKGCREHMNPICDMPYKAYSCERRVDNVNPLKAIMASYNLIKNKHIPQEYIVNDRSTRLKLLAGLIDSDGYISYGGKRVVITQVNKLITCQIEFVARSLGFTVNITTQSRKNVSIFNMEPKDYQDIHKINISGELLHEIPTLIERKKCFASSPNKDGLRTSISVSPIGKAKYYGWKVDSNSRFVLPDMTVVHNCDQMWCTQCHVGFSWKTGKIEMKIHNPHYYQYLRDNGGVVPRNPGDVPCPGGAGNILGVNEIYDHVRRAFKKDNRSFTTRTLPNDEDVQTLVEYRRMNEHIRYVEINNYVTNDRQDNIDLRIQYLIKEIDESRFKQLLQQREKKASKKRDIHGIITMYQDVTVDIIGKLAQVQNVKGIKDIIHELNHLRTYTNDCLKPISTRYNCVVPQISDKLTWEKRKY